MSEGEGDLKKNVGRGGGLKKKCGEGRTSRKKMLGGEGE